MDTHKKSGVLLGVFILIAIITSATGIFYLMILDFVEVAGYKSLLSMEEQ
jgi:hypothetical protein